MIATDKILVNKIYPFPTCFRQILITIHQLVKLYDINYCYY